ncbi:hypothetical protein GQX73_g10070 [Xylaria multiplex]|uniref:Ubiquitin-like domain-containing protein n=1 Tax=Xylaria multiplex TaxID=323545 RepID=A0A7C8MXW2_9PEZI|nr:hypothetical protein GQX73_g10070 [Xylaria multiplex]
MSDPITSSASEAPESSQFTLQILSPSLNVPQPLFLDLPITTTVRQLKERIRGHVRSKPPDDAQRLIHRGRLLARDSETMLELFGEELLRSSERQTVHLVLRDLSEALTPTPPLSSSQHPGSRSQTPGHQHPQQHQGQQYIRVGPQHPAIAIGFPQPDQNGTQPPPWTTQQLAQNQIQALARLGIINQHQNQNPGPNSVGHHGTQNWGGQGSTISGRTGSPFQPETTRTVIREGIGPDGQRWRFTVNESYITAGQRPGRTSSPLSSAEVPTPTTSQPRSVPGVGPMGGHDVRNIFRTADAGSATRAIANAMRRNASSSSLANLASHQGQQPIPPGVTTPLIPSRTGSAAGTPDPLRATGHPNNLPTGIHTSQVSPGNPEVYILSSPSGPRAILLNGSLGTYYSPQLRSYQPVGFNLPPMSLGTTSGSNPRTRPSALPQIIHRSPLVSGNAPIHLNNPPPSQQPQLQPQHELQAPAPMQGQFAHGMDNPQIHAIRLAQVWPHIWMIIRLALFIWWFTSPASSWSRWITVVSIAVTLFIVNTGVLNPFAEQIWIPLRRYLENLIPLAVDAQGHQQQRPVAENAQGGDARRANAARPRDPNPVDAAARLIEQRRENNANWLLNQARRLERAGILFIASLAPGLAERHIAQVEAEARAERQRQQEAEVAATSAAQIGSEDTDDNTTTTNPEAHESPSNGDPADYEAESPNSTTRQNANAPTQEAT